jgi:rSAM/selenodomain-associated transferase 2
LSTDRDAPLVTLTAAPDSSKPNRPILSVVVPMLNEESAIIATLTAIRAAASQAEIIVVDGGSTDRSVELARAHCDQILTAARGRARQMNVGATAVGGDIVVFVHADTIVPATFARDIADAFRDPDTVGGRFDVALDDSAIGCRVVGGLINLRSRLMRSATGDQAIFVRRDVFEQLGGFAEIDLCEDVDFAARLRRCGGIACLRSRVTTSARRWRKDGLLRTVMRMSVIKSMFLAGVSPRWLKRHYADTR